MSAPAQHSIRSRALVIMALAGILEHLEESTDVDAGQYRTVVARLKAALAEPLPDVVLDSVLRGRPAAQTLYANMREEMGSLPWDPAERSAGTDAPMPGFLAGLAGKWRPGADGEGA